MGLGLLLFFNQGLLVFLVEISVIFFYFTVTAVLLSRIISRKKDSALEPMMYFIGMAYMTNTIVIPYNRVQHVALHGFVLFWSG
jgi:predicted transporter